MQAFLQKIVEFATHAGLKLLIALLSLILGFRLIGWLTGRLKKGKLISRMDASVRSFLISGLNIALKVILFITLASYLGLPMTSTITLVGSAGVAVGLALQGGLSNIAGGIMILFFRPFSVGDIIQVEQYEGTVLSIGIFHTVLRTYDNTRVVIPNSVLTGKTLVNLTGEKFRRVVVEVSAAYRCDSQAVREAALQAVADVPEILSTPAPSVVMSEHGDSAVLYKVLAFCPNEYYWTVKFRLTEQIKRRFDERGIEIPFPQVDVHLPDEPGEPEKK